MKKYGLSGQQRKKLLEALNDAFRDKASLERMLAFELDKNLGEIAGGINLQEIVFNLIQIADAQGWIEDLVRAACKSNPGNLKLKAIAQELLTGEISQIPLSNIPQEPNNQQQPKILLLAALPQDLRFICGFVVLVVTMLGAATVELLSKKQPDETQAKYAQVEYYLNAKNWQAADIQTSQLMINIAKREKEGYLDYDSINTFSCPSLKRIDQLWVSNSNKRFGFSVQKEIWIQTGNRLGIKPEQWNDNDKENYKRFSRVVGWYDDNKVRVNETGSSGDFVSYDELLSRIKTNPLLSPRGSLPKNLAFDYGLSNQGVLFSHCDL